MYFCSSRVIRKIKSLPLPFLGIFFVNALFILSLGPKAGAFSWDFPGHGYQAISSFSNLKASIYNFKYFLGFYPILYPPLFHTLKDILVNLTNLSPYKAMLVLVAVFQTGSMFILYKTFRFFKVHNFYYFSLSLLFIITSIGFNNISFWESGTVAACMGFFLFNCFLYIFLTFKRNYRYVLLGWIFGIAVLSHVVTASAILAVLGVAGFVSLIKLDVYQLFRYVISALIGLTIGAIWFVPYLAVNSFVPRGGMTGYTGMAYAFLTILLVYLALVRVDLSMEERRKSIFGLAGVLLLILGIMPLKLNNIGIQFNRYYYYGLLAVVPFAFAGTKGKKTKERYTIISLLLIFLFLVNHEVNRSTYPIIQNEKDYQFSGRILDATTTSGKMHFPHYFNTKLVLEGNNLVATGGTFVESAPNAILALSLRMAVNNEAWFPLFTGGFRNILALDTKKTLDEKIKLFGISHIIFSKKNLVNEKDIENSKEKYFKICDVRLGENSKYPPIYNYVVQLENPSPLVEPLSYVPEYANDRNLYEAWEGLTLNNLYTKDSKIKKYFGNDKNLSFDASVKDLHIDTDELTFNVTSDKPAPVLIKFAYSPLLKAYADGREIDLLRVSPDFMLIFAKGNVKVTTYVPKAFVVAKYVTYFSFILISTYILYRVIFDRKVKK